MEKIIEASRYRIHKYAEKLRELNKTSDAYIDDISEELNKLYPSLHDAVGWACDISNSKDLNNVKSILDKLDGMYKTEKKDIIKSFGNNIYPKCLLCDKNIKDIDNEHIIDGCHIECLLSRELNPIIKENV